MVRHDLDELRETIPEMAKKIGSLPWIEDGITSAELSAVRGLILLANLGHSASLLEQPWVVEGRNYPALEALWIIAVNQPEELTRIMSHPTVTDGITDQEAKIIATLGFVLDPDLLDKLLDPAQVTLEERTITLPLAGETDISIVRTRPGADHTMDLLERAVRSIEEFMGLPFPQRQAIYLFEEAPSGGNVGENLQTHVSILADEQTLSGELMLSLLAHETSHYYWTGLPRWIIEGAATFLESIAKNTLCGSLDYPPCAFARSIAELEDLERDPSAPWDSRLCHYKFGERLFRDLYRNMDDTTFRLAFRRLHLHTVFNVSDHECDDYSTTICHVKEAFTTYAPEETASVVEEVIARWYDGTEPYDLSSIDDTPARAEIGTIDGRIEGAYLSLSRGALPSLSRR